MEIQRVREDGFTRTFWFADPVFACNKPWANLNVPFSSLRCSHKLCEQRVKAIMRVDGVFYVGVGELNERALFITLRQGAAWADVEPKVKAIIETFEPAELTT